MVCLKSSPRISIGFRACIIREKESGLARRVSATDDEHALPGNGRRLPCSTVKNPSSDQAADSSASNFRQSTPVARTTVVAVTASPPSNATV